MTGAGVNPPPAHGGYQEPFMLSNPYLGVMGAGWGGGPGLASPVDILRQQQLELFYRQQLSWSQVQPLASPSSLLEPAPTDLSRRPRPPGPPTPPYSSDSARCLDLSTSSQVDTSPVKEPQLLHAESRAAAAAPVKAEAPAYSSNMGTVQKKFRAALKNGELVPDEKGSLVVTHIQLDLEEGVQAGQMEFRHTQVLENIQIEQKKKDIKVSDLSTIITEQESCSPKDCKIPKLTIKLGQTGGVAVADREAELVSSIRQQMKKSKKAAVVWHFLWYMLGSATHTSVIRWIDEPAKKFQIVDPDQLARLWARLKENPTMDWSRLQKVLELYLRKNFIRASDKGLQHVYTFTMDQKESER